MSSQMAHIWTCGRGLEMALEGCFREDSSCRRSRGAVPECSSCISVDGKVSWYVCRPPRSVQKSAGSPFTARGESVGQKYYMIPSTTTRKIKKKYQKKLMAKEAAERKEEAPDRRITVDSGGSDTHNSVCSAKEYYGSKEDGQNANGEKNSEERSLSFPHSRTSSCRGINWEPSLTSVQELSP